MNVMCDLQVGEGQALSTFSLWATCCLQQSLWGHLKWENVF